MDDLRVGKHTVPASELEEIFETHGGPGGQHANRNETAVRLRFDISASSLPDGVRTTLTGRLGPVIEVSAADSRSQFRNRSIARKRMRERLEAAMVEPPLRRATKPTRASKRRRVEEKRARSETKRLRRKPDSDY